MDVLEYPFDSNYLILNRKRLRKELLSKDYGLICKIAILGGSTTSEVKNVLELFLLNEGIKPEFYESEYNQFYEDAMFGNESLESFKPDIIYIHTTMRNLHHFPSIEDTEDEVQEKFAEELKTYENIWESLKRFNAPIIQNNFELPPYRLLGNKDFSDYHGRVNYINRLNNAFSEAARKISGLYIADINYVASCYGLDCWFNEATYCLYKYAMDMKAIPYLAFNLAHLIKAIYGKNKKALVVDLDNTLWGGVIGDDGVTGIRIGSDTPGGEVFYHFQQYLLEESKMGNILLVNSKNDEDIALEGLNHPSSLLRPDDFTLIKANWNAKSENIKEMAETLDLGADSFVFIDDNPAERKEVKDRIAGIAAPNIMNPEDYIRIIDHNGYFEVLNLTEEDLKKKDVYRSNAERKKMMSSSLSYTDYLKDLHMHATIKPFEDIYLDRITQLTNKSNQFNLTTKRYTLEQISALSNNDNYLCIYGKLSDIFGDNGLISVIIGKIKNNELHIELWLMSCRVLKRNMEHAMLDELISLAKKKNLEYIYGYYYPTNKNKMVMNFYDDMGFTPLESDDNHKTYILEVNKYENKNNIIEVN